VADKIEFFSRPERTNVTSNVLVFPNTGGIARFAAKKFKEISADSIREKGRFLVALSGGKTPVEPYREIAREAAPGPDVVDWRRVHVFLVDERFVPYDDERSNYAMIKRSLLDHIGIPSENVHPVPIEEDPDASAEEYESELREFLAGDRNSPTFDMILLGMGEDGHTASLFPGIPNLGEDDRIVRAIGPDGTRTARITLTLPAINRARNVIFLVSGASKACMVRKVIEEKDPSLPASLVRPVKGELLYLLDKEAASTSVFTEAE
jgi:6-phosphogluconolactonase